MDDVVPFGFAVAIVALAAVLAVLSNRLSERVRVPAPAFFLVTAAVASDIFPSLRDLPIKIDQRLVTIALVVILFDGGMHIGWSRFREAAGAVVWIGVAGTAVTAGGMALLAHFLFGFSWLSAMLLGTALAPTDPAVVFSVLGRREIAGRTGTIVEGESGANDPVAIALMVSLLGATGGGVHAVVDGAGEFALQMVVGAAIGAVGGYLLLQLMRRVPLPNAALYPVQTIAFACLIYGVAAVAHGSGFLAVFLAGIIVGDARAPYKREIEHFAAGLSTVAEIVVFTVLGLTISLKDVLHHGELWTGLALAALLILLVRPLLVGLLLAPVKLRRGERAFVLWAGLKGAVPIALGTFVLTGGVSDAGRIYRVIFVVVLISVVVQGGLVPTVARLLNVPMRVVEPEPWALGMRFRDEPEGLRRYFVRPGSPADGCTISGLDVGETAWISMVSRGGQLVQVRGQTVLQADDEVLLLADSGVDLVPVFGPPD
ncbi:MAG: potassium/hydrogen antiporter [Pseudonocardiales bacterium]|jgi:cell volume regulation protein A|nr:potassium/hydrogen antiporter [Pseudonocardiales bacterium]